MDVLLNKEFLNELGVTLDESAYATFSEHYEGHLRERVVDEITSELNETQLTELHSFDTKSDEELQAWLKANVPQLKEIIEDEVAILLGDIAEDSQKF